MSSFLKRIKHLLMRFETPIVYSIGLVLSAAIAFRLRKAIETASSFDGQNVLKTAKCVMNGISPYHQEVWTALHIPAPAHSPALSIIFMPVCLFSKYFQDLFFFFIPLLFYYAFVYMVFYYYGYHPEDYLKPRWRNLPVWIVLTMLMISSPMMMMLSVGQTSSIATLLLFAALLFPARDKSVNFIFLGLAAAVKYSMLTFQVPLLLLQKRFRMAIMGFVLFAVLVLSVGFWLDGIIPTFKEYILCVSNDIQQGGTNSYTGIFQVFFLHIGFFKHDILNHLLKVSVIAVYVFALWKIYCRGKENKSPESIMHLSCAEWGLFSVMTCIISYHRLYDAVIIMPFLGVLFLEQSKQVSSSSKVKSALLLFFLFFWACPRKYILAIENLIAVSCPAGTTFFHYGTLLDGENKFIAFPLIQCIMLFLLILLSWIVFSQRQTTLKADPNNKKS